MDTNYDDNHSRFKLSQIYLFVGSGAEYDGFNLMKIHVVDTTQMSWKFVHNFPGGSLPHINISVRAASRHQSSVR